jgi:predicted PurR-regulated permease PerM
VAAFAVAAIPSLARTNLTQVIVIPVIVAGVIAAVTEPLVRVPTPSS